ncbi:MAG TPA: tRNA dihydrouridine synthase DusB [bacterium]|nr:tRNA dihydrouridine synthase DusB [bacterium]
MDINRIIEKKVFMAPMAGVNSPAFCEILRDYGCPVIYTALLTSHGLRYQNKKTLEYVNALPDGPIYIGQLFGGVPEIMAEAAVLLEKTGRFEAIDINMGCPAPKVIKGNSGVGLMRDPALAESIVKETVNSVKIPVTVKIRSGWSADEINCVELAARFESAGAAALTLHPRTRTQGFKGAADWSLVGDVKKAVAIPVIGSGDITSPEAAARRMRDTGCDAVMIGRAARGDPEIISRAIKLIGNLDPGPPPGDIERIDIALKHLRLNIEIEGPERGVRTIRGHIAWYLKGLPGASAVRAEINQTENPEDVALILKNYMSQLDNRNCS